MSYCKWKIDSIDYNKWITDCKEEFMLNSGTPKENRMTYCCYCGREIEEEDYDKNNQDEKER